jgi:hypothetical protein
VQLKKNNKNFCKTLSGGTDNRKKNNEELLQVADINQKLRILKK